MMNTIDLDSNSEKKLVLSRMHKCRPFSWSYSIRKSRTNFINQPMGNPPTLAEGMGIARVGKTEPIPLPQCTLPETRTGS